MADAAVIFSFPPDQTTLEQLSPAEYDHSIRHFIAQLARISKAVWQVGQIGDQNLLEIMNPAVNSIPYLYVLVHQFQSKLDSAGSALNVPDECRPGGELWLKLINYLNVFDPIQIRYVGSDWRRAVEYVDLITRLMDTPAVGLVPIRTALSRMDPSLATFTSVHLLYLRLCHEVRAFYEALPILDQFIRSFPSQSIAGAEFTLPCADHFTSAGYITVRSGLSDRITAADVHEYFLLGANTYLALRQYKQAQLLLEYILTTPTQNVASGLMAEAYRKWVLVGCLVDGAPSQNLKPSNSHAIRTIKLASKAYDTVAEIFQGGDPVRLQAEIDVGAQIWNEDGNSGLIREVQEHQAKLYVRNLQKTYAAAPVSTVAKWLGQAPDAAEAYLKGMVDDGFLNATIEQSADGQQILRFHSQLASGPRTKTEQQQLSELVAQTKRTDELAEHVKAATQRLSLTKEYVEFAKKKARQKDDSGQGLGETMDTSWDAYEQDEDMMADL
ncbi:Cop9 signalosome subunit 3 [Lasiodiplodia theobromae]|uniref:Cop9 signalosome subunit 3 n=1 Tax=Lasiodiplodia theobromae TaxID=45133 RepID=UPI0015C3262C|nr:Cop9 signalosome subunit 3 [Lasiodiplodia theobromae]KAF4540986.1 Cop9 signalosome subunit 3 [Lasiodiplodia theobromae]